MESSPAKKIIIYYFPAFIWMGIIFYLSSIPALKSGTTNISLEIFLRKSAHLFEFMILAFLFWRIAYQGEGFNLKHSGLFAFVLVSLYAISDEIHQIFIENRAGKVADTMIDILGGSAVILFMVIIRGSKKNLKKKISILMLLGLIVALIVFLMIKNRTNLAI